jgi:hypothetical protein
MVSNVVPSDWLAHLNNNELVEYIGDDDVEVQVSATALVSHRSYIGVLPMLRNDIGVSPLLYASVGVLPLLRDDAGVSRELHGRVVLSREKHDGVVLSIS